jgi:hypothetical protein
MSSFGLPEEEMIRALKLIVLCASLLACACGKDEGVGNPPAGAPPISTETTLVKTETGWRFRTSSFTLGPGEERFLCFATDAPERLSVKRFFVAGKSVVHHFLLSSVESPKEPYGESQCDVLFKISWRPMFVAGAGDSEIDIPAGAARFVESGTQVVLQMHLLNSSKETVTDFAEVNMEASTEADPNPVGLYVFGTTSINLPPKSPATVQNDCATRGDVNIFAMMPHMHYQGRSLKLELGPNADSLTEIYKRDPYDFDQQTIEPLDLQIPQGTMTRVTCNYENDRDEMITFGESTTAEMCFAIGFAVAAKDSRSTLNGCFAAGGPAGDGGVPKDPSAGECGQHPVSESGIGRACTLDGNECGDELFCTAGQPGSQSTSGICIKLGCSSDSECGTGGTCCNFGGTTDICIPEACRPNACIPK